MRSFSAVVLAVCVAAVVLLCGVHGSDPVQVHSLFPPILKNYWANGMQYWAFGRHSVVTDQYVQLTSTDVASRGYLWNRHSNALSAFQLNVTVQMRSRDGSWFSRGGDSGFGIWYADDPKVNYQTSNVFFGFKERFRGVGAVLDHANELHLVVTDGSFLLNPTSLRTHQAGSCHLGSLGTLHATISISFEDAKLRLHYTIHPDAEPVGADFQYTVLCAEKRTSLPSTGDYHFGVTAANTAQGQAEHTIHSISLTALADVEGHQQEEDMAGQPRLFNDPVVPAGRARRAERATATTTNAPRREARRGVLGDDGFE